MKKVVGGLALAVLLAWGGLFAQSLCAQEDSMEQQEPQQMDEAMFAYGDVASVSAAQIVIREYDYENDQEVENTYLIDDKTQFEGIASWQELQEGDSVIISYIEMEGKKVLLSISKEDTGMDEGQG